MIKQIMKPEEKQKICRIVLDDLPEWFGIEESTNMYIDEVKDSIFFAYFLKNNPVAFYSLKPENIDTLNMFVLGVKKKYHHQGIGQTLQNHVFDYAKKEGYQYCSVLTLSDKHPDKGYQKTRNFYHKMGFVDIYQSDNIWNKENPAQLMIKRID